MDEVRIDWAEAAVDGGQLTAPLAGEPTKEWAERVASVIRDVAEGRLSLVGMGDLGRAWVEREADREVAFDRYRRLVADVVASSSR